MSNNNKIDEMLQRRIVEAFNAASVEDKIEFYKTMNWEIPKEWITWRPDGSMHCCGVRVAENEHCSVCGSLNYPLD